MRKQKLSKKKILRAILGTTGATVFAALIPSTAWAVTWHDYHLLTDPALHVNTWAHSAFSHINERSGYYVYTDVNSTLGVPAYVTGQTVQSATGASGTVVHTSSGYSTVESVHPDQPIGYTRCKWEGLIGSDDWPIFCQYARK